LLLGVECERIEAPIRDPERLVEAALQLRGFTLEPVGKLTVTPDFAGELGGPELRVVDVPLRLDRRDRRLGQPTVRELL